MPSTTPVLDPKTQWFLKYLESLGRPQVYEVPVEEARAMHAKAQALAPVVKRPAQIEDRAIPVGPHGSVKLRIFRPSEPGPERANARLPVVMYLHGGGWVLGDADTYDYFMREVTNGAESAVVFVEYRRAPEARYPALVEECYAATKWVADHASELGVNAGRLAVAGDSAGGNMSAAVCQLAKQRGGPEISAQVLIYPATDTDFETASANEFSTGYFLTKQAMQWFWRQYAPDRAADREPTACPLQATLEQLADLPPALVITAECDPLRDEGEAYARKLMQAGVPVICTRYLGAIHGFMGINALADTPATRAATAQMNGMLREAFAASSSEMAAD